MNRINFSKIKHCLYIIILLLIFVIHNSCSLDYNIEAEIEYKEITAVEILSQIDSLEEENIIYEKYKIIGDLDFTTLNNYKEENGIRTIYIDADLTFNSCFFEGSILAYKNVNGIEYKVIFNDINIHGWYTIIKGSIDFTKSLNKNDTTINVKKVTTQYEYDLKLKNKLKEIKKKIIMVIF